MIYEIEVSGQADRDLRGIFRVMYAGRDTDNHLNFRSKKKNKLLYRQPCCGWRYFFKIGNSA